MPYFSDLPDPVAVIYECLPLISQSTAFIILLTVPNHVS